ncbi:hypothetical protein AVEN_54666-2-1, partial [Araneus ventricosus]
LSSAFSSTLFTTFSVITSANSGEGGVQRWDQASASVVKAIGPTRPNRHPFSRYIFIPFSVSYFENQPPLTTSHSLLTLSLKKRPFFGSEKPNASPHMTPDEIPLVKNLPSPEEAQQSSRSFQQTDKGSPTPTNFSKFQEEDAIRLRTMPERKSPKEQPTESKGAREQKHFKQRLTTHNHFLKNNQN